MKRKHLKMSEAAAAIGVTRQRVHQLLQAGRIEGARQPWPGGPWLIPTVIRILPAKRSREK